MKILVDIGGTYARFAVEKNGKAWGLVKYAAADFRKFEDALAHYRQSIGDADKKTTLLMSTAAHPDGKVWRFVNRNAWVIDPAALKKKNIILRMIINDFEAATWGLIGVKKSALRVVKKPHLKAAGASRCLIGPGTGLGLAYLRKLPGGRHIVQPTLGGHLPTAAVTAEQELMIQTVRRVKKRRGVVVYEDLVSGQGLLNIYNALCEIDNKPKAAAEQDVLAKRTTAQGRAALRLFHEFFGLFAATVTVTGNAFGGLYLTGGITDRLAEKDLFDFAHFEKFFLADLVPSVRAALDRTGVYHVNDPVLALRGLLEARGERKNA